MKRKTVGHGWAYFDLIPSEKGSHEVVHKMPSCLGNYLLFEFFFWGEGGRVAYISVLTILYKNL